MRKLEKELLTERKAQRELEAEQEKYGDKESFVTGAYKAGWCFFVMREIKREVTLVVRFPPIEEDGRATGTS